MEKPVKAGESPTPPNTPPQQNAENALRQSPSVDHGSEKELAAPTFKKGFGYHPLCAFVDHGAAGTGEPLSLMLRAGNAGSNTAADHITVLKAALAQLPGYRAGRRPGRKVLIRIDGAGCTHDVVKWLERQRLSYSVGYTLPENTPELLALLPKEAWTEAYDAHDEIRDGAWVAELTGLLNRDPPTVIV